MNELYPLKSMTTPHTISLGYTLAGKESRIIYDTADQDFLVESVALDDVSETIPRGTLSLYIAAKRYVHISLLPLSRRPLTLSGGPLLISRQTQYSVQIVTLDTSPISGEITLYGRVRGNYV